MICLLKNQHAVAYSGVNWAKGVDATLERACALQVLAFEEQVRVQQPVSGAPSAARACGARRALQAQSSLDDVFAYGRERNWSCSQRVDGTQYMAAHRRGCIMGGLIIMQRIACQRLSCVRFQLCFLKWRSPVCARCRGF